MRRAERFWTAIAFAAVVSAAGCTEPRMPLPGEGRCATWESGAHAVIESRCGGCHSGEAAKGKYRVDSYIAAVSPRDDGTRRVRPGDDASMAVRAARGQLYESHKTPLPSGELATVEAWVVACRGGAKPYKVHYRGWRNPSDPVEFHGVELRRLAYRFDSCRECHGEDLRGGRSNVDCWSCHAGGPAACSTCHGDATSPAPPRGVNRVRVTTALGVGAHRTHAADGPAHKAFKCEVCHLTPTSLDDEGHVRNGDDLDDGPAEVAILGRKGTTATWDRDAATCRNAYCHAPSADANATRQAPQWTNVGKGEADCGTCHGKPPSTHSDDRCQVCHPRVFANGQVASVALHVNGTVELGDGSPDCYGCHGDAKSPAPPRDLLGRTDAGVQTVGAHRGHLARLRGPLECNECHLVPTQILDPGHLDSAPPAEVFPQASGVGTLARKDGANPSYDPATATCSDAYCHGGGLRMAKDQAPGLLRRPVWTGGVSQAYCGACHGLPPQDGSHTIPTYLPECARCHGKTMNPDGSFKFDATTGQTTHINGVVDFGI